MDSRAGAVTEAYDEGAREQAMDLATHQERKTSQRYNRDRMTKASRVSTLHFGSKDGTRTGRSTSRSSTDDIAYALSVLACVVLLLTHASSKS